ncbi:GNAT family N-acetyltransferase [Streptomyces sp. NPDC059009]|uniref:GNAT family N-acetyltransferase n=1 Tax=Streptomyces sp. NPDC059009 TaxID=3346694 RepID=UPI0036A4516B
MNETISYAWRGPLTDDEMSDLVRSHGGHPEAGWWPKLREHSLGWVTARDSPGPGEGLPGPGEGLRGPGEGLLVGFVNVAWDGCDHAFLIDTKTRGAYQRRGIATAVVRLAADRARAAGCEWLHVDFQPALRSFYFESCGFRPTDAGLIHLPTTAQGSGDHDG